MFTPAEVDAIVDACEDLVDELVRDRQGHRLQAGSYVFDPDFTRGVIIKWEGDSDVVHGIEPFAHLSPALERVGDRPPVPDADRPRIGGEASREMGRRSTR